MSINIIQVTANASTPTFIGTIPNGPSSVVITNANNAGVLIGTSTNLTQTNGFEIPPNQRVEFQTYGTSRGANMYALVATGGSTGPVSMLVSSTD